MIKYDIYIPWVDGRIVYLISWLDPDFQIPIFMSSEKKKKEVIIIIITINFNNNNNYY